MKQKQHRYQVSRQPIIAERVRGINGGFAFIEHRFLHSGFFAELNQSELLLYILLVLMADRRGISFYSSDSICSLCRFNFDDYLLARNALIAKDLIGYDGRRFQVLSLPERPCKERHQPLVDELDFENHDPDTIRQMVRQSIGLDE